MTLLRGAKRQHSDSLLSSRSLHRSGPAHCCSSLRQHVGTGGQFPWPHRGHTSWSATPWATVTGSRLCKMREKQAFGLLQVLKVRLMKGEGVCKHTSVQLFPGKFKLQHKQKYLGAGTPHTPCPGTSTARCYWPLPPFPERSRATGAQCPTVG